MCVFSNRALRTHASGNKLKMLPCNRGERWPWVLPRAMTPHSHATEGLGGSQSRSAEDAHMPCRTNGSKSSAPGATQNAKRKRYNRPRSAEAEPTCCPASETFTRHQPCYDACCKIKITNQISNTVGENNQNTHITPNESRGYGAFLGGLHH